MSRRLPMPARTITTTISSISMSARPAPALGVRSGPRTGAGSHDRLPAGGQRKRDRVHVVAVPAEHHVRLRKHIDSHIDCLVWLARTRVDRDRVVPPGHRQPVQGPWQPGY